MWSNIKTQYYQKSNTNEEKNENKLSLTTMKKNGGLFASVAVLPFVLIVQTSNYTIKNIYPTSNQMQIRMENLSRK